MYKEKAKIDINMLRDLLHAEAMEAEWGGKACAIRARIREAGCPRKTGDKAVVVKGGRRINATVASIRYEGGHWVYRFRWPYNNGKNGFREVKVHEDDLVVWACGMGDEVR